MKKYAACPQCDYNKQQDILTGSFFRIYECTQCQHLFCHKCVGANGGKRCPQCQGMKRNTVGEVQLRR